MTIIIDKYRYDFGKNVQFTSNLPKHRHNCHCPRTQSHAENGGRCFVVIAEYPCRNVPVLLHNRLESGVFHLVSHK